MTMVLRIQIPNVIRSVTIVEIFSALLLFITLKPFAATTNKSDTINLLDPFQRYRNHRKLILSDPTNAVPGQWIIVVKKNSVENVFLEMEKECKDTPLPNRTDIFVADDSIHILMVNTSFESIANLLDYNYVDWIEQVSDATMILLIRILQKVLNLFTFIFKDSFLRLYTDNPSERLLDESQIQYLAPWGLDRLDRAYDPLDWIYEYKYVGKGVDIYVIDSGIQSDTNDLDDRVECELNLVSGESCDDGINHGTAIAAVAAGSIYGVSKMAKVKAVKIINSKGEGTTSLAIKALDFIARIKSKDKRKRIVVNLSLGGSFSQAFNTAVDAAVDLGIVVVAASGNEKQDACGSSPGSSAKAITVAASDQNDKMYSMSNFGDCVDIVA
jgi:subtilisin family serine protease